MNLVLSYGIDSQLDFDLPPEALLQPPLSPRCHALPDLAGAVANALASPLEFPPVEQMVVPGDRVTIVLAPGVPQAPVLVHAVLDRLASSQIDTELLTVLLPPEELQESGEHLREALEVALQGRATLLTHVPSDQTQLGHLGINPYRHPIYLNRALTDADAVILIGQAQLDTTLGYHGPQAALYPTYADPLVLRRFRAPKAVLRGDHCDERIRSEIDAVNQQLGVRFTLQVVPGLGDEISHVLAGDIDAVTAEASRLCEQTWRFEVPRRAHLVVATISGPPELHSWENLGRALSNAMQVVEENGVVVLCTDLDQSPGPGVQALIDHGDPLDAVPWIRRTRPTDILPALAVTRLLDHARIHLLSNLQDSLVEDLGMTVISDPTEVARLAGRHESCLLIADAHRLTASAIESY